MCKKDDVFQRGVGTVSSSSFKHAEIDLTDLTEKFGDRVCNLYSIFLLLSPDFLKISTIFTILCISDHQK
jgi:hypothetical protein